MLDIHIAIEPRERQAAYELRYQVIVEEQNGPNDPAINHATRTIAEPADETASHFVAISNGNVVGALRANLLRDGLAEPFSSLLEHHSMSIEDRSDTSFTSRLVVSESHRSGALGIRLAQACYAYYLHHNIKHDHILIRPGLVRLYSRMGYIQMGDPITFSAVGELTPMVLEIEAEHLYEMRSILVVPRGSHVPLSPKEPCDMIKDVATL